jgi:hypothetical protein
VRGWEGRGDRRGEGWTRRMKKEGERVEKKKNYKKCIEKNSEDDPNYSNKVSPRFPAHF